MSRVGLFLVILCCLNGSFLVQSEELDYAEVANAILDYVRKDNSPFKVVGRLRTDGLRSGEGYVYNFSVTGKDFQGIEETTIQSVAGSLEDGEQNMEVVFKIPSTFIEMKYLSIGGMMNSDRFDGAIFAFSSNATLVKLKMKYFANSKVVQVQEHEAVNRDFVQYTFSMDHPLFQTIGSVLGMEYLQVLTQKQNNHEISRNIARKFHEVVDGITLSV